jgi:DNA invertase Pin-like site-specific DNA recombinase
MKAAIYYRVSSKRQEDAETIESQRLFLPEWVKRRGWTIVAEFEDLAIPGKETQKRDGLMELLDAAQKKPRPFDVLVIRDWSRLARTLNILDQAMILGTLQDNKIHIAELHRGFLDLSNPNDILMAQIQLWQAGLDNENRAKAVRMGHRRIRQKGGYSNKKPYGLTYNKETMEFGVDRRKYKTVETMLKLLTQGWGLRAVGKVLNGNLEKFPLPSKKGKRWLQETIRRMVNNDFYFTGIITPTTEGNLPVDTGIKMFSEKMVMDARREMGIRRRRYRPKNRKQPPTVFTDYLLTGMLRCDECGYAIGPHTQRRVRKQSLYYVCRGKPHDRCTQRMFRAKELEDAVFEYVIENTVKNREKLEQATMNEEFVKDATRDQLADMIMEAENTLIELDEQKKRLRSDHVKGRYKDAKDQYEKEWARIEHEQAEAELTIQRATAQMERPAEVEAAIKRAVQVAVDEMNFILLQDPSLGDEFNQLSEDEQGDFIVDMLTRLETMEHDPETEKRLFHIKRNMLKHLIGPNGNIWVKGAWSGGRGRKSILEAFNLRVEGHLQVKQSVRKSSKAKLDGIF